MQYGNRVFFTVAYGRVRAQVQSGGSLFIGGKSNGISKFWAFTMSCQDAKKIYNLLTLGAHARGLQYLLTLGAHAQRGLL